MRIAKPTHNYLTNNLILSHHQEPIRLGSSKRIQGSHPRSRSKKRGISIFRDESKQKTVEPNVSKVKNYKTYQNLEKSREKRYPQNVLSYSKSQHHPKISAKTPANKFQNKIHNEYDIIQKKQVLYRTEHKKQVANISKNIDFNSLNKVKSHGNFQVLSIEKNNYPQLRSNYRFQEPIKYIPQRATQFGSPDAVRPSSRSKNKFIVNFKISQLPVNRVHYCSPNKIEVPSVSDEYMSTSKQCYLTKQSKDTCAEEISLNKSNTKYPLQNSRKSDYVSQKTNSNLGNNSKSIWDAYKTQSIVSDRSPSQAIKEQFIQKQLNRLKKNYIQVSNIQQMDSSLKMDSLFKTTLSSYGQNEN